MIKILAKIYLYKNERKTPFKSGYRPLFNFIVSSKTSGQILLLNGISELHPGEESIVEIRFLNKEYLGSDFKVGKKFTFDEGRKAFGEGEILEIEGC